MNQQKRLTRRYFLRLAAAAGLGSLIPVGGAVYSWLVEPDWLQVEPVEIPLPNLPAGLEGLRIAQISDIHAGLDLPPERLEQAVEMVAALDPDLVVMTGDWVTYDPADAGPAARTVARLTPPLGIYSILGNHDHWTHAERVAAEVQAAGLSLLRNSYTPITVNGENLWLAGVDDIWEQQHDLEAARAGAPAGAPVILLAHEPDYADTVAADGRVNLQLSGHSHGGQMDFPLVGAPVTPRWAKKYRRGLYQVGEMALYVNRGIGTVRPAVRFNCRPEITLITLIPSSLSEKEKWDADFAD